MVAGGGNNGRISAGKSYVGVRRAHILVSVDNDVFVPVVCEQLSASVRGKY